MYTFTVQPLPLTFTATSIAMLIITWEPFLQYTKGRMRLGFKYRTDLYLVLRYHFSGTVHIRTCNIITVGTCTWRNVVEKIEYWTFRYFSRASSYLNMPCGTEESDSLAFWKTWGHVPLTGQASQDSSHYPSIFSISRALLEKKSIQIAAIWLMETLK